MKKEDPWRVMQGRQPTWTEEDEKRLNEKKVKERLRYANLPENENQENEEEEDE
jgi:hypothetical protein